MRKKLRRGEFARTVCLLSGELRVQTDDAYGLVFEAVVELCEARGLFAGGGIASRVNLCVVANNRDVTEHDRAALLACIQRMGEPNIVASLVIDG
ncbi:MAG: DUF469 family protein [Sandaracinaceae bacterium]|nr:DUF469 family protein [Sandaracinaceae bacterium]